MTEQLTVRSHVARDLLQTAALFKTDRAVVWEYVSNAIDYVDDGVIPTVFVSLDAAKKSIRIVDNGRGMNLSDLQNFFTMHGENVDRKSGRPKRGLFGTGKSAAFGIADVLRVNSVRDGRRTSLELTRSQIQRMGSGDPVPIRILSQNEQTPDPNGTVIEIEDIRLKRLDQAGVIQHIEQHLSQMPPNAKVYINHHECEYREPPSILTRLFHPDQSERKVLGNVELVVKAAGAPLDEFNRGVAISSNGVLYERTLAGLETTDMAQYLFGKLEIPVLDGEVENADIPPLDMSRAMRLNPENSLVAHIYSFIGQSLEVVRKELVEKERARKQSEEAKKLATEAKHIARVINDDFTEFRQKVARIDARARGSADRRKLEMDDGGGELERGTKIAASPSDEVGAPGSAGGTRQKGTEPRSLSNFPERDPAGDQRGDPMKAAGKKGSAGGGFEVRFENMGSGEFRAKYVRDERTIFINLDHPQLVAAKRTGSQDLRLFRQLSYEIAFSEYAIALASELDHEGEYIEPSDAIVDIRTTVNRLARRGATLFGNG